MESFEEFFEMIELNIIEMEETLMSHYGIKKIDWLLFDDPQTGHPFQNPIHELDATIAAIKEHIRVSGGGKKTNT